VRRNRVGETARSIGDDATTEGIFNRDRIQTQYYPVPDRTTKAHALVEKPGGTGNPAEPRDTTNIEGASGKSDEK